MEPADKRNKLTEYLRGEQGGEAVVVKDRMERVLLVSMYQGKCQILHLAQDKVASPHGRHCEVILGTSIRSSSKK